MRNVVDKIAFARDMVRIKPVRLHGRYWRRRSGLWRVATRKGVRGGFLVARGRVVRCSPAIRRHLHVWAARNAEYFGELDACFQSGAS